MKIVNDTHWQTKHLRAFASRVAKEELEPAKRKRLVVHFVHSRWRQPSGWAYIKGNTCRIRVPRDGVDKCGLAMILAHEFAHCRGFGSGRSNELALRSSARYGYRGDYASFYSWAVGMPLERKAVKRKPKPTPDIKADRIRELIVQWDRKKRRAETALRKYRKRLRYYEKRAAASQE